MEQMIYSVKVWESWCCEDVEMGGDRGVIVVFEKRGSSAFWLLSVFLRLVWHISTQELPVGSLR